MVLVAAASTPAAAAEPIEIFDAHLHYNWEPKPYYQLDEVLALFKKHHVTGILATSRPNTGTHALIDAKPEGLQVVPFIRPYRVRADIESWFGDPVIFDLVQDEFKRGYYRGRRISSVGQVGRKRVGEKDCRFCRCQRSLSACPRR